MLVGNLHSVALIDLTYALSHTLNSWEPSFCSLDRLTQPALVVDALLGTFIL